jgi:hypothetical protein
MTFKTTERQCSMNPGFMYSFVIGFVGAVLFLLVDRFERNSIVTNLL